MENFLAIALNKITNILESEKVPYMIVGGFATSYHNRARTTNDIDIILQISPKHVKPILSNFPEWIDFEESFLESIKTGIMFNITDFETGIRYDFMTYQHDNYNRTSFQRRQRVEFLGTSCFMCSKEDLIISKIKWYDLTESEKQLEDIKFLLLDADLDKHYILSWIKELGIDTHGLLE